jgi:transcription elongation factor GreA
MVKNYLSKETHQKLKNELLELKTNGVKEALSMIQESKTSGGELSENSEYLTAKDYYDSINNKISKLEERLKNSEVLQKPTNNDSVQIFSSVRVKNITFNREMTFHIVSEEEIDVKSGKISYNSPIGSSLEGKSVGDKVSLSVPSGLLELEILEIF